MRRVTKYRCPECKKDYNSLQTWANHVQKQHPTLIPEGWTPARYFYYLQTGKTGNQCIICKKPTNWNEAAKKYERFCPNPKCKEKYREIFKNRMINKYGKTTLLNDPEQQRKMLERKKIHGVWEFTQTDHSMVGYNSSYEMDFLRMMDEFLRWNGNDIMAPSPHTYYYEYRNPNDRENEGTKMYIPDFFIPSLNLEIEIKQNTSTHPKILAIDKIKEDEKDKMMESLKDTRYIKITDKDYREFFNLLIELQETMPNPIHSNPSTYPAMVAQEASIEENLSMIHTLYNKLSKYGYGWNNHGKLDYDTNSDIFMQNYRTMTPEEFYRLKGGICYDYVNFIQNQMRKKNNLEGQCYYICVTNDPLKPITHTFYVTPAGPDEFIYIECAYKPHMGIYKFRSLNEVVSCIVRWIATENHIPNPEFFCVNYSPKGMDGFTIKSFMSEMTMKEEIRIKYNPTATMENLVLTEALDSYLGLVNDTQESFPALEGFFDFLKRGKDDSPEESKLENILKSWKEKIFGNEKNALVGGTPHTSKYVTPFKVLVDEKKQIISIQNINIIQLIRRIRDTWEEKRLDYIFDRTYRAKDITLFNKKRMSRGQMRITSLTTPTFFALELVIIFKELYRIYRTPDYAKIANEIYKKTWLSRADSTTPRPINLSKLKNINSDYQLKTHQLEFIQKYPQLVTQLNLRGFYLAFDQGLGKTLTASALAEVLEADHIYIVCPNTMTTVWKSELHDYFGDRYNSYICNGKADFDHPSKIKFFIVNNEATRNMLPFIDVPGKKMMIVDEMHNFRNMDGKRVQELVQLREKLNPSDVLLLSGTPIKAIPSEIVPALMLLDPLFTNHAAQIYNTCFKFESYMAMDIVKKRFGQMIYRKTKEEVLQLPNKYIQDLRLKIKKPEQYYMPNVQEDVKEAFHKWYDTLAKDDGSNRDRMLSLINQYSTAGTQKTKMYINMVLVITDRTKDSIDHYEASFKHELDQTFFETFIDTYIANNPNISKAEVDELHTLEKKFIRMRNSAMGHAIGEIYPPRRASMFNALFDENKALFEDMIVKADKKTVIFSQLLPVVKHLTEVLNRDGIKTVSVVGGMKDRMEIINQFRKDPSIRVIVATSQTMGVGVTLVEAAQMFFFGPPWRSADYDQCCDRIYRIGQTSDVYIWNVRLDTETFNLSDRMNKILNWSSQMFHSAIDASVIEEGAIESMGICEYTEEEEEFFRHDTMETLQLFLKVFEEYDFEAEQEQFSALEAAGYSSKNRYPIYILLTQGNSPLSYIIRKATGDQFSHASIAFDSSLDPLYSFGTKSINPTKLGFIKASPKDDTWGNKAVPYSLYVVYVSRAEKEKMKQRLEWFKENADRLKYYWGGLVRVFFHVKSTKQMKWFCSEFVATIINAGRELTKNPTLYRPQNFINEGDITFVCSGPDIKLYREKDAQNALKALRKPTNDTEVRNMAQMPANEAVFKNTTEFRNASPDEMAKRGICALFTNNLQEFQMRGKDNIPELIHLKNTYDRFEYLSLENLANAIYRKEAGIDFNSLSTEFEKKVYAGTKCALTPDNRMSELIAYMIQATDRYRTKNPQIFVFIVIDDPNLYSLVQNLPIGVMQYGAFTMIVSGTKNGIGPIAGIRQYLETRQEAIMLDVSMKYAKKVSGSALKSLKLYHISIDGNLTHLSPRLQTKTAKGENVAIPRICAGTSPTRSFNAMPTPTDPLTTLYIYRCKYEGNPDLKIYKPSPKYVSDAEMTDEHWIVGGNCPVEKIEAIVVAWDKYSKKYRAVIPETDYFQNSITGEEVDIITKVSPDKKELILNLCKRGSTTTFGIIYINSATLQVTKVSFDKLVKDTNTYLNLVGHYLRKYFGNAAVAANESYEISNNPFISTNLNQDEGVYIVLESLMTRATFGDFIRKDIGNEKQREISFTDKKSGKVVAYIKMKSRQIVNLYVAPEYRGRGYAKKMINIAINRYEANYAEISKGDTRAMNIFSAVGFQMDEALPNSPIQIMRFFY